MPRPLSLSDFQITMIRQAAATVSVVHRDTFLRGVALHLGEVPTDDAVRAAIDAQLKVNRLPSFIGDSR